MKETAEDIAREVLDVIPLAMRRIREEMRSRRGTDLTMVQFRTLLFLQRHPGAALRQVADHLGLTPPTVSKMINTLAVRGILERPDSAADRRKVELRLTARGDALIDRVRGETVAKITQRLERLAPEECEQMFSALDLLRGVLREHGDGPVE
jgi:DNA-binding MarR family transcriptional regulator